MKMSIFLITGAAILGLIIFLFAFCFLLYLWEKWDWNKGYCRKCKTKWKIYERNAECAEYRCKCGRIIYLSYF
jgi:hypothetical protein